MGTLPCSVDIRTTPRLEDLSISSLPNRGWKALLKLVHRDFPYCTMYGVRVGDGCIVSCRDIQTSLVFGPAKDMGAEEPPFDEHWQAFMTFCVKLDWGELKELSFHAGRPVNARRAEGGRRFSRF